MKRVGVLTGGGDAPGLNPVIRAVTRKAIADGYEVVGFKNGWRGLIENDIVKLDMLSVSGILHRGGTVLGTSRTNPSKKPEDLEKLLATFKARQMTGLIAIGGEDTLGVANRLVKEYQLPVVGVPKTIDNDLSGTEVTFGFDTAVNIAMEAIDRLHTTAESHHRIMVVEVMGRHAGWIGLYAGIAGGADVILVPEVKIDLDEVCALLRKRQQRGKEFSIVVVAEGAQFKDGGDVTSESKLDAFGHVRLGGVGQQLAEQIETRTGFETRVTVLGHIQRGGSPTAYDRVLGTRYGIKAMELIEEGKFGMMVALRCNQMVAIPIDEAVKQLKTVDMELYNMAKVFFG